MADVIEGEAELFDYREPEPEVCAVAVEAAEKIKPHAGRAKDSLLAIGQKLIRGCAAISSGDTFSAWLKAEFDWSWATAYHFISVTESRLNLRREDLHLVDVSALYEAARERAAAGERVTHASVKQWLEETSHKVDEAFASPAWRRDHVAGDGTRHRGRPPRWAVERKSTTFQLPASRLGCAPRIRGQQGNGTCF